MDSDIAILRKETGLGEIEAERLFQSCDGDVVEAILKHQNIGAAINIFRKPSPKINRCIEINRYE